MTIVAAGFVLGVAASVHCVLMCGPLMMAVLPRRDLRAAILYHGGRLMTYALLGAITGAAGHLAGLAGAGRLLSVAAGLALIWAAARRAGWLNTGRGPGMGLRFGLGLGSRITRILVHAAQAARVRFPESSPLRLVSAGILNGLLPCGPVYAASTAAAVLGDSTRSAALMLAFGAGTLPVLAVAGTIASRASLVGAGRWRFVTPVTLAVLGILLTARGFIPAHDHAEPRTKQHAAHHN
jgi:hypothetical protein